jgi:Flp pilus assembly protein TadB
MAEGRGRRTWEEEQARAAARSQAAKEKRARPLTRKEIARLRVFIAGVVVFVVVWAVLVNPVLAPIPLVIGAITTPAHQRRQILGLPPKDGDPPRHD